MYGSYPRCRFGGGRRAGMAAWGMAWLSKRWLLVAVAATVLLFLLFIVYDLAGIDTNIDTGSGTGSLIVIVVFLVAAVAWCGVILHALVAVVRNHRPRG